jgi:Cu2+-containing amine oxidase
MLQEPAKAELLMYEAGRSPAPARQAYCVLISIPDGQVIEAVVDLHSNSPHKDGMHSWKLVSQPMPHANIMPAAVMECCA